MLVDILTYSVQSLLLDFELIHKGHSLSDFAILNQRAKQSAFPRRTHRKSVSVCVAHNMCAYEPNISVSMNYSSGDGLSF